MNEEQRIEWLLELQELTNEREQSDACINSAERGGRRRSQHPEQLTEEQLQQILADDEMRHLVQQLGFAKRAFKHDALKNDTPDVEGEWEKFAASHSEELEILDEGERLRVGDGTSGIYKPRLRAYLAPRKIAASFIGVLLASGIAFAAIQVVRNISTPKPQQPTAIAAAHRVQVEFENEAARQLRFHFVWKREDSLDRVVEKLNTFEAVNIGMEDKTLVVK